MLSTGLSTGIFVLAAILFTCAGAFAFIASTHARNAAESATELASGLRRLRVVHDELATLNARLDKVAGRVYAQSRRAPRSPAAADVPEELSDLDPELAAELALQLAPPVEPAKRN